MPKISWAGADEDELLTAADIDEAEEGFQQYAGELPPGGVYRFKIGRAKYTEFNSGNQGLNVRMNLDGSWKPNHRKFDGCPLWDRVVMTKGAASFVKAFCQAIGVSAADLISRVVVDEDGYVTKIGKKSLDGLLVYVAVKRDSYEGNERLEIAGTGYQTVEEDDDEDDEEVEETPAPRKSAKAAPAPAKKSAKRAPEPEEDDEEEDEDEEVEEAPRKPAKKSTAKAAPARKGRRTDDDDEPPF